MTTGFYGITKDSIDENPLVEGLISGESFISVRKKNVLINKVGQIILTENGYFDISTRKKSRENRYSNLSYKEYTKTDTLEDLFELDFEDEKYDRMIKIGNISYFESASYASENEIGYMEDYAQPVDKRRALDEYSRITKLAYISREEQYNISNILKINPYLVKIEACRRDKNNNIISRKSINKIYKSKKECIVGYRPEMILIEDVGRASEKYKMYRLIQNEGIYIDNSSFKQNFEGRYSVRKISLEEIEGFIKDMPFALSQSTKSLLRNGYEVPIHIKKIYDAGLEQIHILGLDKIQRLDN